jgi:oligopeptide/dipeptide ABC transporter ATP-binding protein
LTKASEVVGDDEVGESEPILQLLEQVDDLGLDRHVERRRRLVGDDQLGVQRDGAGDAELYARPLHPYTIALLSAIPIPDPEVEDRRERVLLTGELPSAANPPPGCRFHSRCPFRQPTRCADEVPALRVLEGFPGSQVACQFAEQIAAGELTPASPP